MKKNPIDEYKLKEILDYHFAPLQSNVAIDNLSVEIFITYEGKQVLHVPRKMLSDFIYDDVDMLMYWFENQVRNMLAKKGIETLIKK